VSRPPDEAASELGTVSALTHDGEGVVRTGKTAFVAGALPGETIRFRRVRRHRRHDDAALTAVLQASADRVTPRCAHFGVCGGCALQHLQGLRQIEAKQAELREVLTRVARCAPESWLPPLRGPEWGYRRRARLGARFVGKKGRVVVGFRERLSSYVAAVDSCQVLCPPAGELIQPLSTLLTGLSIRERVPQIEVAVGENATALVLRVIAAPTPADLDSLRDFERTHLVHIYLQAEGLSSVSRLPPAQHEPLCYSLPEFGLRFEFAPTDFVQINAAVNAGLVSRAVSLLELTPASRVLDLYCGLGNLTLPLARHSARAVGIEGDAVLIARARHNAALNGVENVEFIAADLTEALPEQAPWLRDGFTHVVLDPPRAGARDVMRTIARLVPERLLYISCHPGSLARDIGMLVHDHGFVLRSAGVLDMFPHTTHVESLAVLSPGGRQGAAAI
jgi:23S rRNA (uracil1939-C5)-methyltransferase